MDSILWPGKELPPEQCISRDKYTEVQQAHLATRPTQDRPLTSLECTEYIITYGWTSNNRFIPKGTNRRDNWFSRSVMIYPNGCDPLSPAACPVLAISWLMRPEVTITFLNTAAITLNVTSPDIHPYKFVLGLNETEGTKSTTSIWESSPQD